MKSKLPHTLFDNDEGLKPHSVRIDENTVELSIPAESILAKILGQKKLYTHGIMEQKRWSNILTSVIRALNKSINNNVISDGLHKFHLERYIENIFTAIKYKKVTDIDIIFWLICICFELLGGLPRYSHRKVLNRRDDFYLTNYRSLQYTQTISQKLCTILEAAKWIPFSKYHDSEDLFQVYVTQFNGNPEGFIDWYKENYPNVYLKLF